MVELNEIKKKLYKENPTAHLWSVSQDGITYITGFGTNKITFMVPLDEIDVVVWAKEMPAKLLIRYIVR